MNITNQEIFDQVCRHLANQKCRSSVDTMCKYRGPGNLKCAVGVFISDEEYDPDWDDNGWTVTNFMAHDPQHRPAILQDASQERVGLLTSLQDVHDNSQDKGELISELELLAHRFSLDPKNISLITEWTMHDGL